MPNPVSGSNPFASSQQTTKAPDNNLGKDAFLKLMIAQMKYQDPLKPTDPQSFMTQTAQFTQVEKLEELTKSITASTRTATLSTAAGLLGRTVTFSAADGSTKSGVVSSASPTTDGIKLRVGNLETTLDQVIDIRMGPATT